MPGLRSIAIGLSLWRFARILESVVAVSANGWVALKRCWLRVLAAVMLQSPLVWWSSMEQVQAAATLTTQVAGRTVSVALADVKTFAETGQVSPQLQPILQTLSPEHKQQMQRSLLVRLPVSGAQMERLTTIPFTEPLIKNLGRIFLTATGGNGFFSVKLALNRAAASPDGLTLLSLLEHYPGETVQVDLPYLLLLTTEITVRHDYRQAAIAAVAQAAQQEAATAPGTAAAQLVALQARGPYEIATHPMQFAVERPRDTPQGKLTRYDLPVDFILPQGINQPVPLIIFSHGFGASRDSYRYLAEHYASHGFAVAAVEHLGSNWPYRKAFLEGALGDLVTPQEFIERSRDITFLLDELEKRQATPDGFPIALKLDQVGVIGNSLGGTTALSMGGAPLNVARLRVDCNPDRPVLGVSMMVQCLAEKGASRSISLGDRRVKAVVGTFPLTSSIFGPESLSQIAVPTLIISGSADLLSSPVADQIHPFVWLTTPHKYLAVFVGGTHFSSSEDADIDRFPPVLVGQHLNLGRNYLKALSTGFFQTYLQGAPTPPPPAPLLNAKTAQSLSQSPLPLLLVESLTAAALATAYGRQPPLPVVPDAIAQP